MHRCDNVVEFQPCSVLSTNSLNSLALVNALLDFGNRLARIQALWADLGTVHDLMTPVQLVGIINLSHAFLCEVVPGIYDPPKHATQLLHK